jgi:hypothetical protein
MKKAIVMLLAFAVIGGFVFAQDDVVPRSTGLTIAGSGTVSWGINLNDQATGFKNESSIEIKYPLIDQGSSTHGGDPITGEITLKDLSCAIDGDTAGWIDIGGGVEAKIKFPNSMYMTVYGNPGLSVNNAKTLKPWVDYADDNDWDDVNGVVKPSVTTTGGVKFGMDGDFSFSLIVASNNDYSSTPTNVNNDYGIGANVGYKVTDLLSADAGIIYGILGATPATFGGTVKVTVNPKDSGLTAVVAADLSNVGAVSGMDAMVTVDYALAKLVSLGAGFYYGDADLAATAVAAKMDVRALVKLLAVENLNLQAAVDAWNLASAVTPMELFAVVKGDYTVKIDDANYVKPYETFTYCLNNAVAYLSVGVEAKLFPRTVLDANYTGGTKPGNDDADLILAGGNLGSTGNMGIFKISAKVSY